MAVAVGGARACRAVVALPAAVAQARRRGLRAHAMAGALAARPLCAGAVLLRAVRAEEGRRARARAVGGARAAAGAAGGARRRRAVDTRVAAGAVAGAAVAEAVTRAVGGAAPLVARRARPADVALAPPHHRRVVRAVWIEDALSVPRARDAARAARAVPVSYTHLTLPTICSV
eukprot:1917075-Prymnesium_polylepis.1